MKVHYLDTIISPNVTEKSTSLSEFNKIVFKVDRNANKKTIKKNIEKIFKVNVIKINTVNMNGKVKLVEGNYKMLNLILDLKIPLKKVAIELNKEIVDKKKLKKIKLKNNDKIEIVHFIGGG